MNELPQAELEAMLAEEFGRHGWDYGLGVAHALAGELRQGGPVDPAALAARVSSDYLERTGIGRSDVEAAIERAVGSHRVAAPKPQPVNITIKDQRYQLHVSGSSRIEGSNLNFGGTQVNVDVDVGTSREEVLAGVEVLLRAGFAESWDPDAADALEALLAERGDISAEDVSLLTRQVGTAERPAASRISSVLEKVAVGAATSTLGAGLTAGLGFLLQHPPT